MPDTKNKGGFEDHAEVQRAARWKSRLRRVKTGTGTGREVEKDHQIQGEGTVVTVVRGKNLEKYWVAPFRSRMLKGLADGDSRDQALEKLGRPYRSTGNVLAYACLDFSVGLGGDYETYSECLRVYLQGGTVVAAKYFLTRDCEAVPVMEDRFFSQAEVLKQMKAHFRRAGRPEEPAFKKYPSFAFSVQFKDDSPKVKRRVGTVEICEGPQPVFESLYSIGGGKAGVILKSGKKEEVYWVGRFRSNKLKGVTAGDSRRTVMRKLGVPFQRTSYALAYACKDWAAAEYGQQTVYKTCPKIFFKKWKTIDAYYSHKSTC